MRAACRLRLSERRKTGTRETECREPLFGARHAHASVRLSVKIDPPRRRSADCCRRLCTGLDRRRAGWGKPYLSSSGPADEFIERDHDFFVAHRFVIIGRARFDERVGSQVPDTRSPRSASRVNETSTRRDLIHWTIGIELVREDDSWKVAGADYTAGPPAESVDRSRE